MHLSDPANIADRLLTLQEAITIALQSIQPIAEMESVPLLRAEGRVLAVHWADLSPDAVYLTAPEISIFSTQNLIN